MLSLFCLQMVSFLLDLPEKDEEEVERAQINNSDSLWGETGRRHHRDRYLAASLRTWLQSHCCCQIHCCSMQAAQLLHFKNIIL